MKVKSVLITGCSSGIGFETALFLAQKGFQVYAGMRNLKDGRVLHDEASRRRVTLEVIALDIDHPESIQQAVKNVISESGQIYGLVNNAGIQLRGFFEDLKDWEIRKVFETNVFGTMAVIKSVLPHMRKASCGRIVLISSIGGKLGSMALSAYCSSKFALEGFGESLAQEVRSFGMHVILVEPAIIHTSIWSRNRGTAGNALDADSLYRRWFINLERLTDLLVESSRTRSLDVAKAVHRSLTIPSPRLRYMVGRRAQIVTFFRRYVPEAVFAQLYFGGIARRVKTRTRNSQKRRDLEKVAKHKKD